MSVRTILAVLFAVATGISFVSMATPGYASVLEQHASGFSCMKCFWEEIDRQGLTPPV